MAGGTLACVHVDEFRRGCVKLMGTGRGLDDDIDNNDVEEEEEEEEEDEDEDDDNVGRTGRPLYWWRNRMMLCRSMSGLAPNLLAWRIQKMSRCWACL